MIGIGKVKMCKTLVISTVTGEGHPKKYATYKYS
jgi:hypothetical protein